MLRRAGVIGIVVGLLLGLAAIVATPLPAGAAVTRINPPSRDVDPGGSTTAGVSVAAGGSTCISAVPSQADLEPTLSPTCTPPESDGRNWSSVLTVQIPDAPGTYRVTVSDDRFGGDATFTLRVRTPPPPTTAPTTTAPPPPPPPPPPTTTTTRPPTTTTAPATTTTAAPETTTTEAATTTTESTTTTLPEGAPGDPFQPVAQLLEQPLPTEGIFLPLVDDAFRACLPLTTTCSDDGSGLALVPARTSEILWQPLADESLPAPRSDLRGVQPIPAVGVGPADPRAQQYVVSMLDLTTPQPALRSLIRSLDARGDLVFALGDGPRHDAVLQGPDAEVQPGTTTRAESPFGRPSIVRGASFTEAAPVIPMYAADTPQVVYAVRADVAWGLNLELLPLLGDSLPYLARRVDGPPGLFFARPAGLRVPSAAGSEAVSASPDDSGGIPALALLSLAVIVAGAGIGAAALIRRRRNAGPQPAGGNADDYFGDDF